MQPWEAALLLLPAIGFGWLVMAVISAVMETLMNLVDARDRQWRR
jgi:hypothetical protein